MSIANSMSRLAQQQLNRPLTETVWFNALWFQSIWFCAVLGRDTFLPVTALLVALHPVLAPNRGRELLQMAVIGGAGIATDSALRFAGIYIFEDVLLIPVWLMLLWFAFATTLTRSLAFIGKHPLLAALLGGAGVPFNYFVGMGLGAVEFGYSSVFTATVLVIVWSLLTPAFVWLARRLSPTSTEEAAA
jgi:hypothetical protein